MAGTIFEQLSNEAKGRELSVRWYRSKINELAPRITAGEMLAQGKSTATPNYGLLNLFNYKPLGPDRLKYYDMFPLIMLIGFEKETFLGLNFHYLNPKLRAILLDRVTAKIGGGIIKWNKIVQIPQVAPTVKRYRYDHIMRKVIPIEEKEQELAIFLPLERFKKASRAKVWADSKKRIGA